MMSLPATLATASAVVASAPTAAARRPSPNGTPQIAPHSRRRLRSITPSPRGVVSRRLCRRPSVAAAAAGQSSTDEPFESSAPSMAQTIMRGPLKPTGSGKPLTKDELAGCKAELEALKAAHGFAEPVRSFMGESDIKWRYGGAPDYSLTNLQFLQGRTKAHPEGSLELVVENLVKTWEMERSHKVDPNQHQSVDPSRFTISANGAKKFNNDEANAVGNYNVLMAGCPANLWDAEAISWEQSHEMFHDAFAAFPWEILEVFSGPPTVAFTWRHWANFTGTYEGNKGKGELVEMYGFGVAEVDENLKLVDVAIYYKPDEFLEVMRGDRPASDLAEAKSIVGPGCPFLGRL